MDREGHRASHFMASSPLFDGTRCAVRTTPVVLAVLLALAMVVGSGWTASQIFYGLLSLGGMPALAKDAVFYLLMFGLALALLFAWVILYERRELLSLLGKTDRFLARALRGTLVGISLGAGTVAVLAVFGAVSFESPSGGATGVAALGGTLAAAILSWAFPAVAEEVIARGWLLQDLGTRRGVAFALIVSAMTFAAWHWLLDSSLGPLPLANLVLVGVFWGLYALGEGSLVGVCFAHTAYNWSESNLFGFDYYGAEPAGGSLINLEETGPDMLTGGGVGLNTTGSLAFSFVLLAAIALLLLFLARRGAAR